MGRAGRARVDLVSKAFLCIPGPPSSVTLLPALVGTSGALSFFTGTCGSFFLVLGSVFDSGWCGGRGGGLSVELLRNA